jgi:hypothetical protein
MTLNYQCKNLLKNKISPMLSWICVFQAVIILITICVSLQAAAPQQVHLASARIVLATAVAHHPAHAVAALCFPLVAEPRHALAQAAVHATAHHHYLAHATAHHHLAPAVAAHHHLAHAVAAHHHHLAYAIAVHHHHHLAHAVAAHHHHHLAHAVAAHHHHHHLAHAVAAHHHHHLAHAAVVVAVAVVVVAVVETFKTGITTCPCFW